MPHDKQSAKETMDRWFKARAKEQRRAEAVEASRPRPTVRTGQAVEIVSAAKVKATDGADVVDTDHHGAAGLVESTYYSTEKQTHVAVVRCEDNQIRGIPEHKLRSMRNPAKPASGKRSSVGMSGAYAPGQHEAIFGRKQR